MSEPSKEAVYDAEIAPAILEVGRLCERHGMSMVAAVEYGANEIGQTAILRDDRGFWISLADFAIRAKGNVDTLILGLMRHAREHGHGSMMLMQLGVPASPSLPEPGASGMPVAEERIAWREAPIEATALTYVAGTLGDSEVAQIFLVPAGGYRWVSTLEGAEGAAADLAGAKAAVEVRLRSWLAGFRRFMDARPPGYPGREA